MHVRKRAAIMRIRSGASGSDIHVVFFFFTSLYCALCSPPRKPFNHHAAHENIVYHIPTSR